MRKKTYIKPGLYSKKIVVNPVLAGSLTEDPSKYTGEQDAKPGNGFDWGTPGCDDSEEDGI